MAEELRAAHTQVIGISIDTVYCHAAWAEQLGGVSFPLISDFHPKGEIAKSMGVYLADRGITDRATVILDAGGTVRYAQSVGPPNRRDVEALVAECQAIDASWADELPAAVAPQGLAAGAELYIKDSCMFSRWAMSARRNLHLEQTLPLRNVSQDQAALDELVRLGGKPQAPALVIGDQVMYESAEIAAHLAKNCSWT
ncbi:Alkyl hydroperoxide reductase subunit C-like protein [Enhygromyxa salina]|uniref:Alkyl hydroperoxide reductase subunit C-like protein n=1 Tax=Enhygromyxa salina TaxID=215803 RepID=A0A0C2DAL9_9BACT|nr:Alkyl hydroperoxide reductase subunit C-like protein [Enhygromyxa salina]